MPSRPNHILLLAIACSMHFAMTTEATALQTKVSPNFPTRITELIDRNQNAGRTMLFPVSPSRDVATRSATPSPEYQSEQRNRIRAFPASSNTYSNPLRASKPVGGLSPMKTPSKSVQPKSRGQKEANEFGIGQYRPSFGTVMTFPAADYSPNRRTGASFSFGDSSPVPRPSAPLSPEMLQRQFALQQHVFEQEREIAKLRQMMQQAQPSLAPNVAPPTSSPSVDSLPLGFEAEEPKDNISPERANVPLSSKLITPKDSVPSVAIPVELSTSIIGPESLVEGSPDEFEIIVTNSGDLVATNVVVQISVPADITISQLDREAWLDQKKRTVSWKIPSILGREREVIRYSAVSKTSGRYGQTVAIGMENDLKGETSFETVVLTQEEFLGSNVAQGTKE